MRGRLKRPPSGDKRGARINEKDSARMALRHRAGRINASAKMITQIFRRPPAPSRLRLVFQQFEHFIIIDLLEVLVNLADRPER